MPKADISVHPHQFARTMPTDAITLREDILFSNYKGEEKAGLRKRNLKAVKKLQPALERLLHPGEAVLYIARARSPLTLIEQLTAGWWTYLLASAAVVFTNQRIFFLPVKQDGQWKESVRSAQWGDLVEVKSKGFITRTLTFTFRNGKKEAYLAFRAADAKKIAVIAQALIPAGAGEVSVTQGIVQLCPDCRRALVPGVYSCSGCGLIFKNEKTMVRRSVLLPAGGYFYTGHPMIAILPALVETVFIIEVLAFLFVGATDPNSRGSLAGALIVLLFFWGLETAVTILHCRRYIREYIPEKRSATATNKTLAARQAGM